MNFFFGFFIIMTMFPLIASAANLYSDVDSRIVCIKSELKDGRVLLGTGFFLDQENIATVAHQVADAAKIVVFLSDSQAAPAIVLGAEKESDVSILRVPKTNLQGLPLQTGKLQLGDEVFTIGCPLGLEHTLSRGVISHVDRQLEKMHYVQIDMEINNGNSGGPVINKKGEVIGLVKGSWEGSTGLNFAVPISSLRELQKTVAPTSQQTQASEEAFERGISLFQENRYAEAKTQFEDAVRLQNSFYQAYTNLGLTLFKLGKHKEAEKALIKAISINPEFAVAYLNLGMVYAQGLMKKDAARQAFLKNLELNPDGEEAKEVREWLRKLE